MPTVLRVLPLLAAAACAACAAPPGPAPAGVPSDAARPSNVRGRVVAPPVALVFASIPGGGSSSVTREDVAAAIPSLFASADTDRDGVLTVLEYASWADEVLGARDALPGRLTHDRNADGAIIETEFAATLLDAFDRMDTDGDANLTRAEMVVTLTMPSPRGGSMSPRSPGGPGGGGGRPRRR